MSATDESFSRARLEYPQWTRPAEWNGKAVPAVLQSGDHAAIERVNAACQLRFVWALLHNLVDRLALADARLAQA